MRRRRKIMAVASSGGHWQQLMRLKGTLPEEDTLFVTTNAAHGSDVRHAVLHVVTDANRDQPLAFLRMTWEVARCVVETRPQVILSTGAAPGLVAILFGRVLGARTLWIDSVANAEEVSLSGRIAIRVAQRTLTQWPHLARPGGPDYEGSIL